MTQETPKTIYLEETFDSDGKTSIVGGKYPDPSEEFNLGAMKYVTYNDLNVLHSKIIQWAVDRNLQTADQRSQILKVIEEVGEIAGAIAKGKTDELKDAIGDTFVTIAILAECSGLNFTECVQQAYNAIKDRKGKLVNGVFIKEDDL